MRIFILCALFAKGEIIVPPSDTEAAVGTTVILRCKSNSAQEFPIRWHHRPIESSYRNVYEDNILYSRYKERFQIVGNSAEGEFSLEIKGIRLEDAGTFTCSETPQLPSSAELLVLESYPSERSCSKSQPPDGPIGFSCGDLTPDTIHLSCNIGYRGNYRAFLECADGQVSFTTPVLSTNGNVTKYSVELKAPELRHTSNKFICRLIYEDSNLNSSFSWSTPVHVLKNETKNYTASCKNTTDILVNGAISTFHYQCSYSWRQSSKDGSLQEAIHEGPLLDISVLRNYGFYICTATCSIRGNTCILLSATLDYTCPSEGIDGNKKVDQLTLLTVSILVGILAGVIAVVLGCFFVRNRRQCSSFCHRCLVLINGLEQKRASPSETEEKKKRFLQENKGHAVI